MSQENEETTSMTKMKIGDQEFMVPENMKNAIEAQNASIRAEMESQMNVIKQESAQANQSILDQVNAMKPAEPAESLEDDGFWDNPTKFIQDQISNATQSVAQKVEQDLTSKYQAEKAEELFWKEFYADNKDLKGYEFFVESVGKRDIQELSQMTTENAKKELADRVRKEMLKLTPEPTKVEEVEVEPSSFEVNFNQEAPKPKESSSLGDIIRKKNKIRHEANKGI